MLQEVAEEIDNPEGDLPELASVVTLGKTEFADLESTFKILRSRFESIKFRVYEAMGDDINSVNINTNFGVYRFTKSSTLRASIASGKKEDAYQWLKENGLGDIITQTVNSSSLSSTVRHLREEFVDVPEEFFKVYDQVNLSVTKVK